MSDNASPNSSGSPVQIKKKNHSATISVVLGALSFLVPVLLSIPAIILGIRGLIQARKGKAGRNNAIDGVLMGVMSLAMSFMFIPHFIFIWETAIRMEVENNLKVIGLGMHEYHDKNQRLPSHAIYSKDGKPLLSWRVAILPHIGEEELHAQFKLDESWDSPNNIKLLERMPSVYAYAWDRAGAQKGMTYFQVFVGEPGVKPRPIFVKDASERIRLKDITDGTSNTILVAVANNPVPWTAPEDILYLPNVPVPELELSHKGFHAHSHDGFHLLFADGAVRYSFRKEWDEQRRRFSITMDDGQEFQLE